MASHHRTPAEMLKTVAHKGVQTGPAQQVLPAQPTLTVRAGVALMRAARSQAATTGFRMALKKALTAAVNVRRVT